MRRRLEHRRPFLLAGVHLEVGEFRNVLRDRIARLPLSFVVQHHHRHAGDRLGHRVDAGDRVQLHRRLLLEILEAVGLVLHDLALARHQRDDAGEVLLIDQALHGLVHPVEAARGKADGFRRRLRQRRECGGLGSPLREKRGRCDEHRCQRGANQSSNEPIANHVSLRDQCLVAYRVSFFARMKRSRSRSNDGPIRCPCGNPAVERGSGLTKPASPAPKASPGQAPK
jgi:hypothetical protein